MNTLIRIFVFMVLWIVLGQTLTHFFYPELWETENTRQAIPWLMLIGYAVGTFATGASTLIGEYFKRA